MRAAEDGQSTAKTRQDQLLWQYRIQRSEQRMKRGEATNTFSTINIGGFNADAETGICRSFLYKVERLPCGTACLLCTIRAT